jgi:hypothetical protein
LPRPKPTQVLGKPLALPANIRLGWKGLQEKNARAYYKIFVNYGCKKFYNNDTREVNWVSFQTYWTLSTVDTFAKRIQVKRRIQRPIL